MNVLELLDCELKDKNWTKDEKALYIYLRSCQLFSYDPRYNVISSKLYHLHNKIENRVIDLENVSNNWVICNTYSDALANLLYNLLGICTTINGNSGHAWATFYDGKRQITADATAYLDISHIKMSLFPRGYSSDDDFDDILKQASIKIGYITDDYNNYFLAKRIENLLLDYGEVTNFDDYLIYKVEIVKKLFEEFVNLKEFSDIEDCISYLFKKVLKKDISYTADVQLYNMHSEEDFSFVDIFPVYLKNQTLYYALEKIMDKYCFHEISGSDARQYVKSLDGFNKEIIKRG